MALSRLATLLTQRTQSVSASRVLWAGARLGAALNHRQYHREHEQNQDSHSKTASNAWKYAKAAPFLASLALIKTALCEDTRSKSNDDKDEEFSLLNRLRTWYGFLASFMPKRDKKLLPDVEADSYGRIPRTVVIAFENVLADPTWDRHTNWTVHLRDGAQAFVSYLKREGFEVVIWSRSRMNDAAGQLEVFDESDVKAKLYSDDLVYKDGHIVFDLDHLNRDPRRVILIDYDPGVAKVFPGNVIRVPKWKHTDKDDLPLYKASLFLTELNRYNVPDCRPFIKSYREHPDSLKKVFQIYKDKEAASRKLLGLPEEVYDRTAIAKLMSQLDVPVLEELGPETQQLQQVWLQQISDQLRAQRGQQ